MTVSMKPSSVTPTIGRRMWYFDGGEVDAKKCYSNKVPFDAGVIYVWSPDCVNLLVTDHAGKQSVKTNVMVADYSEDYAHGEVTVAAWMPYQTQAKAKAGGDTILRKLYDGEPPADPQPEVA